MIVNKDDYVLGVWYAENEKNNNWLMTIKRDTKNKEDWQMEYRFRYAKDDKAWDSDDVKNFYNGTITGLSEEEVLEKCNTIFEHIQLEYKKNPKYIEVKGDGEKFAYLMAQENWCNVKMSHKDEEKKK